MLTCTAILGKRNYRIRAMKNNVLQTSRWYNQKTSCLTVTPMQGILMYSNPRQQDMIENRDRSLKNHHHHVVPPTRIFLTPSRPSSLSFIASDRFSGLHPVSSHSCCMYVRAGLPTFARPYGGSIRVYYLWARPCFSSSVLHVRFV